MAAVAFPMAAKSFGPVEVALICSRSANTTSGTGLTGSVSGSPVDEQRSMRMVASHSRAIPRAILANRDMQRCYLGVDLRAAIYPRETQESAGLCVLQA